MISGSTDEMRTDPQAEDDTPLSGVYIGADATNPTLILRIRSFLRAGVDLTAFTFRRSKFNKSYQPEWRNVHLGDTIDRNYIYRLPRLVKGLLLMLRHWNALRKADFIYARNIDLIYLGVLARWLTRSRAKLVYEVEDVQAVFFRKSLEGAVFRWLERRILSRIDLLVPLSPGFMRGYFTPIQNYDGPYYVLENKLQLGVHSDLPTDDGAVWKTITDRWVIGWFGTLRCEKSMAILEEIAERLGDKVEIYTRGYPTETGLDHYMKIVNRHPNWTYDGEYTIPDDLESMYGRVHFSWCIDFLDENGNSPLLIACRLYQGGFYGALPLVVEGTEMNRWAREAGVGYAFAPPYTDTIVSFVESLNRSDYDDSRERAMARRSELFLEDGRETRGLLHKIATSRRFDS